MAPFHLVRTCPASPAAVWAVLTDFAGYGSWIPLTTMRVDGGTPRVGWGFAGLSGIGPLHFSDSMILTRWEPPADERGTGRFSVVKTGRSSTAGQTCASSRRRWNGGAVDGGDHRAAGGPGPTGPPVTDRVSGPMFARALDGMLGEAVRRSARTPS